MPGGIEDEDGTAVCARAGVACKARRDRKERSGPRTEARIVQMAGRRAKAKAVKAGQGGAVVVGQLSDEVRSSQEEE